MENKFFTHRFLPILSVFLLIVFNFISFSYCSSDFSFYDKNNNLVTVPGNASDIVDLSHGFIMKNDKSMLVLKEGAYFYYHRFSDSYDIERVMIKGDYYYILIEDNSYVLIQESYGDYHHVCDYSEVIYFSANLYTDSSKNNIMVEPSENFFFLTPLAQVVLMEGQKKTIVKEMTGILPLILVVVVSFLGLRKALSWLLTLLRRS